MIDEAIKAYQPANLQAGVYLALFFNFNQRGIKPRLRVT
ncbi:putative orphan protein [Pseudoalteromonas translucida]|uniref:Orphan protein n=1 Tax=Pseudoalteromonas translucida (strain TAC 125) TaxID=326442 RepID=Q3III2_PSET1|nr:putative orphan protein [Pseudoalteromonas translucida]